MQRMRCAAILYLMALGFIFSHSAQAQSCSVPVIFTSQSTSDSSVHLFWLSFDDPEVGFELTVVPDGQGPNNGNVISLLPGERSTTVDQLLPNQRYRAFIRSLCLSDTSQWVNHLFLTDIQNQYNCLTDRPIPDNGCGSQFLEVSIHVPPSDSGQLGVDVKLSAVNLIIEHPYPADLRMELVNPRGESVVLVEHHGTLFNHFGLPGDSSCTQRTVFSSEACTSIYQSSPPFIGTYQPDMPFDVLNDGGSPVGEWKLRICDRASDDVGRLEHVSLEFDYSSCPSPPVPLVIQQPDDQLQLFQLPTGADSCILGYHKGSGAPLNPRDTQFQWSVLSALDSVHLISGLDYQTSYEYYTYVYCDGEWIGPSCPGEFTTFCQSISTYENWKSSETCSAQCGTACTLNSSYWRIPEASAPWSIRRNQGPYSFTGPQGSPFPASQSPYLISSGQILDCDDSVHQLRSVCFEKTDLSCGLGFYYHMFGAQVGTLSLLVSEDEWVTADTLFIKRGAQSEDWLYETIELDLLPDGLFQLEFQVSSPLGPFSEIAIGDILLSGLQAVPLNDQLTYLDQDQDDYGNSDIAIFYCGDILPDSLSLTGGDCNDLDPAINPGANDILCSGRDENCDGEENIAMANPLRISEVNSIPSSCPNEADGQIEISIEGGRSPYDIQWNTGDRSLVIDSLQAGLYSVTVSDSMACQTTELEIQLASTHEVNFSFSIISQPDCFHPEGGAVEVFLSGGSPPYDIEWSNGIQDRINDSLSAGRFNVTVTDANGCVFTSEDQTLSAANAYGVSIQKLKAISCPEGSNGELLAQAQGAIPPLSFLWNTGDTTRNLEQVGSGWYQVFVTDSAGCQVASDSLFVATPPPISLTETIIRPQRCVDNKDGKIQIRAEGGNPPYSYEWLSPEGERYTSKDLYNVGPGRYSLTITDNKGCSFSPAPIEVDSALGFQLIDVITDASSCPLSPDGQIDIAIEGGLQPLAINWSDGGIDGLSRTDLRPGFYRLTITNQLECKRSLGPFEIPAGQEDLEVELSAIDTLYCQSGEGIDIEGSLSQGQAPLEYHWSSGRQVVRTELADSLSIMSPGSYTLTVTDSYGCVGEAGPIQIIGRSPIELDSIDMRIPDCPEYKNGSIEVFARTSAYPLRYNWSNGSRQARLQNLSAGSYGLTIEDDTGCLPFEGEIDLSGPPPFQVQIDTFYQNDQVCFEYQITGGFPPYNRFWNGTFNNRNPICFDRDQSQILLEVEDVQSCGPSLLVWDLSTSTDITLSKEWGVKVFPNPANEILYIQSSSSSPISFEVFHISGQKWDEGTLLSPSFRYQMGRYPPGVYVFRFENIRGEIEYHEVIKQ